MFSLSQGFAMPGVTRLVAGQSLAQAAEQGNSLEFCGTCGSPLPATAAFCSRCGAPKAVVALAMAKAEAQAQPLVDRPCQRRGTPVGRPAQSASAPERTERTVIEGSGLNEKSPSVWSSLSGMVRANETRFRRQQPSPVVEDGGPDPSDSDSPDESNYGEENGEEEELERDEEVEPGPSPSTHRTAFCTNCGTPFPEGPGSNFCGVCGASRPATAHQGRSTDVAPGGHGAGGGQAPAQGVSAGSFQAPGRFGGAYPGVGSGGINQGTGGFQAPGPPGGAVPSVGAEGTTQENESQASSNTRKHRSEAKLVSQREIQHFRLPKLASNAAEQRGWTTRATTYVRRFDATRSGDFLGPWFEVCLTIGLKEKDVRDRQGCPRLDNLLVSEMLDERHYKDRPELADLYTELLAYVEKCKRLKVPPCGRWMVHVYHRRFYMDAASGTLLTEQHIYSQKLGGFSCPQVQDFYDKVNFAREALPAAEHPSEHKLGHWLFLQLKAGSQFEHEVRQYKRARIGHRHRKFSYLWSKVRAWLLEQRHDANAKAIDEAFKKGPMLDGQPLPKSQGGGGSAKGQKARAAAAQAAEADAATADEPAATAAYDTEAATAAAAAEAAAKAAQAAASAAREAAEAAAAAAGDTPPARPAKASKRGGKGGTTDTRTAEEKAKQPCMRFFGSGGECRFGEDCHFSHTTQPPPAKNKAPGGKPSGPPPKNGKAPGTVATISTLATSAVGAEALQN